MSYFFTKPTPFYKKKKFAIPLVFIALLVAFRIVLPPIALMEINSHLAKDSPYFQGHVKDLDLNLFKAAFRLQGIKGKLKAFNRDFLEVKDVEISLAWKQLLKGKFSTDILVEGMNFKYLKEIPGALRKEIARIKASEDKNQKESKFKIDRLVIKDSNIVLEDFPSLKPGEHMMVKNIDGTLTNLTPKDKDELSFFNLKANIMGAASVKIAGDMRLKAEPTEWTLDSEVQGFDITSLNAYLKDKVPLTFTHGKVDVYAEAQSEHGKVEGYIKPFIKNLDVIRTKEHFKNTKHWAIEVVTALANLVLRAPNARESVATKIPFTYDGQMNVDTDKALDTVIQHGLEQQLSPGIDDNYDLK